MSHLLVNIVRAADVNDVFVLVQDLEHPGKRRQGVEDQAILHLAAGKPVRRPGRHLDDLFGGVFFDQDFQQAHRRFGIAVGPVARRHRNAQRAAQFSEGIAFQARHQPLRFLDRADRIALVHITQAGKLLAKHPVIEVGVMGHDRASVGNLDDAFGQLVKTRRTAEHLVIDPRQACHIRIDGPHGIDQRNEPIDHLMPVETIDRHFGDALLTETPAGGFQIHYRIHLFLPPLR